MSRVPPGVPRQQLTIVARRVLLDTLEALVEHVTGLTVAGAQAVYLRSPDSPLAVASYTADADFALQPELVHHQPAIEGLMQRLGFTVSNPDQPGTWTRTELIDQKPVLMPVDLMVPELFAGKGRRSAELPPHGKSTAKRVPGIEAVLYDRTQMDIRSLEPGVDPRVMTVHVAGVAALLVAKAYKIQDRLNNKAQRPDRVVDKDAADVFRLFMAHDPAVVGQRLNELAEHSAITEVVLGGRALLMAQFARRNAPGVRMAESALAGVVESPSILATAWVASLRDNL